MEINFTQNKPFKGLYEASTNLDNRVMWSRAIVAGVADIGFIVNANNSAERKEKTRRALTAFPISFFTPILTLPFSNRFAMKYCSKLTKSFWSDNHKIMHIQNKYLAASTNKEEVVKNLKEGLDELSKNYTNSPLESIYRKITAKSNKGKELDFQEILDKCGGDYEKLRKKLVNAKMGVMCSDFIFTSLAMGCIDFVNNGITKKSSGKSGFSAEFEMADPDLVEKRSAKYNQNSKKRITELLSVTAVIAIGVPALLKHGLNKPNNNYFKKIAQKFNYSDGIYMSRLALLIGGTIVSHIGTLLASRNTTELKDKLMRYLSVDAVFFGGDILITSLLATICDKIFKTQLSKHDDKKILKILPKYKSLEEINKEVKSGKISKHNKSAALSIFWISLISICAAVGWGVPALCNKMIRHDVSKDISEKNNKN